MPHLLGLHTDLERIYARLDSLIRVFLLKALRETDGWFESRSLQETCLDEMVFDRIAYSDAINSRFILYYFHVCQFLRLFIYRKYFVTIYSPVRIFKLCYEKKLITQTEFAECVALVRYMRSFRKMRNKEGDLAFTEEIFSYAATMYDITQRISCLLKKPLLTGQTSVVEKHKNIVLPGVYVC